MPSLGIGDKIRCREICTGVTIPSQLPIKTPSASIVIENGGCCRQNHTEARNPPHNLSRENTILYALSAAMQLPLITTRHLVWENATSLEIK